ncbi:MAG: transketolase [Candidatus Doudnabacteria bacterium RIFCSPHIGHO2_01_FULL_50_11]|uniref:Transketolase n=1 Tax=Candidatus Doudnabacteria bacterium RIFCSPHIGHO2_01_FULL_50_11 TaxID=1817828 RepID=A0A1F5PE96_9BACT|nr:MAG: transketolase [Candidatus Doudnabacteria bacterium RIFCSPHIGHO2_01_FULL_50_11]HLC44311.1 transketolase [Patescibacteria group bacterium]
MSETKVKELTRLLRYWCLKMTTTAGSGHLTSSLSAVDLMAELMFGGVFRYDVADPQNINNDRLIFSKGHASPLFYSLWAAAGAVSEKELMTYRKFGSPLEGHPSMRFAFTEAATGSLGQGLSVGVGMALNGKYLDKLAYRTYVLLGDGEIAEGSVWEAIQIAAYYKLNNLIGVVDCSRLAQWGETMYGRNMKAIAQRISAFGWNTITIDGHSLPQIQRAIAKAASSEKPTMIIAQTIKGKGVKFLEDKDGWHGKVLDPEGLEKALKELGKVDTSLRGVIAKPPRKSRPTGLKAKNFLNVPKEDYKIGGIISTRKAYGQALPRILMKYRDMVVLDAGVANSTFAEIFQTHFPERFFEMFIAEQNMIGTALGLARRGKLPFVSTFAAFFTRAFDQIRMSDYSGVHMVLCGSHAGVSVGADGVSQMGLEDIALFRSLFSSIVLYPSDAVACDKLVEEAAKYQNIVYLRTTRREMPVLYEAEEKFPIGGSKVLRSSSRDQVTIAAAGITLHEALKAYTALKAERISVRVLDLYSVKPLDVKTLLKASKETQAVITVEDHYPEGGIGEAVAAALSGTKTPVVSLAVRKLPQSGTPDELLGYEQIDEGAIVEQVKKILGK